MKKDNTMLLFFLAIYGIVTIFPCHCTNGYETTQVLILGGGPAGIHAAANLLKNNITDIIILEPHPSQLRGYLRPVEFGGHTFAPGSLWGFTPILNRLAERNISNVRSNYDSMVVRNDAGEDLTSDGFARQEALYAAYREGSNPILEDIDEGVLPDLAQKVVLARGGWIATTPVENVMEWYNFDFVEGLRSDFTSELWTRRQAGLYTGDTFILSDITLASPLLGDEQAMLSEHQVHYGERAVLVNYTAEDNVHVETESGTNYQAEYVIVTSTVGVIQRGRVTFDPPLPPWKIQEFCRFQMGTIEPIFLRFDTVFWDDVEFILHASDRHAYYPAFVNLEADGYHEDGSNILVALLTGDEAVRVEGLTDDEIREEVLDVLRGMYGAENVPEPTEFLMTRFGTDPDLYGTFTTWPIGRIPEDAQRRLNANIGRVFFAPEDAAQLNIGIPFGSVEDGRFSAAQVSRCIKESCDPEYVPIDPEAPPLCSDVKEYNPNKRRKDPDVVPEP